MAFPVVSHKPRRSTFKKVASIFCFGEPRVDPAASPQKTLADGCKTRPQSRGLRAGAIKVNKDQVDLLVEASSRPVVGTPTTLLQPTQLQVLEEELRNEKKQSVDLQNQLQHLKAEVVQERARSAILEAKVATHESLLEEHAISAEVAQKAILQDALNAAEKEKIRLAKEYEDRLVIARAAGIAVLQGALQSMEDTVAEMAEQQEVHQTLLKHLLESVGEKERDLQAAHKKLEQRRQLCRQALRRQQRAEETLEATTEQLSDANDSIQALWESIKYYQTQLEGRGHEATQLPIFSEADCPFVDHLGAGACATVDRHRMDFAVKRPNSAAEAEHLRKEAEIMACLQHPNIVRPLGWVRPQDDGHWGLAMPYENGGNLKNFIRRAHMNAPPGWDPRGPNGLLILDKLADGLQHAHSQNKVHSDLKPDNILLRIDGNSLQPVIADWGCGYDTREQGITWRGSVGFGRPGGAISPRLLGPDDDIRALCAVTFELFTGLDIFQLLLERLKAKDEDEDPFWRRNIDMACDEFGFNRENLVQRMLVAEAHGVMSVTEEDVAHLLVDPCMPNNTVRVIMRGLSKEGASGRVPMPSLVDIRTAIQEDLQRQQVLEAMGLHFNLPLCAHVTPLSWLPCQPMVSAHVTPLSWPPCQLLVNQNKNASNT